MPPTLDFDFGLGLIDDNGVAMTSPQFEQNDGDNSFDENDLDDDDYADDLVEGDFDDDDDWNNGDADQGTSSNKRRHPTHYYSRAKSPTPIVDSDINKRSRGRRVPTHDNQRVFKCPDARCQKVFVRNEHLKRHIKSLHRDEKPFECLDVGCNKRFTRLDNVSGGFYGCLFADVVYRCINTSEFMIRTPRLIQGEDHRLLYLTRASVRVLVYQTRSLIPPLGL